MAAIYENVLILAAISWVAGMALLEVPRRRQRSGLQYPDESDRRRLLVPLADRLLARLGMVPLIVLPLLSASVVTLAFLHGELNELKAGSLVRVIGPDSEIRNALQWVVLLIYFCVAGLIIWESSFWLRSGTGVSPDQSLRLLGPVLWAYAHPYGDVAGCVDCSHLPATTTKHSPKLARGRWSVSRGFARLEHDNGTWTAHFHIAPNRRLCTFGVFLG